MEIMTIVTTKSINDQNEIWSDTGIIHGHDIPFLKINVKL